MAEPPLALRWKCRHTEEQSEKVKEGEGRTSIVSTESQSLSPKENKITIGLLTHNNIEVVKRINLASFPLTFGDRFYSMIVDNRELSRLAFICDIPVGAVCCRLVFPDQPDEYLSDSTVTEEADAPSQSIPSLAPPKLKQWELTTTPTTILPRSTKKLIENVRLYILSLAVLASFRRSGIGRMLIDWVVDRCRQLRCGEAKTAIGGIPGLPQGQTQVNVTEIYLHVWCANQGAIEFYRQSGFEQGETIEGYYKKLNPPNCVVFKKPL